ncbi:MULTISPECIES: hypothetical protein [unclassified Cryobacterium]|uniref:hypothetical protein n=1 Tax=unclassified Cryobacterium TaxID=2649013 RepID=UPI002B224476|nr:MULTISPECIES: hypothetical protein [unclassified Cryobacterium]MEA9999816.1 hypothetical protein [Cryobacterium sp. RTS3]
MLAIVRVHVDDQRHHPENVRFLAAAAGSSDGPIDYPHRHPGIAPLGCLTLDELPGGLGVTGSSEAGGTEDAGSGATRTDADYGSRRKSLRMPCIDGGVVREPGALVQVDGGQLVPLGLVLGTG